VTDDSRPAPHAHHLRVQRTARYYTLGGESPARGAIWFLLHGYGQLAGEFIRYFSDLASDDSLLVAPEAMNRFYLTSTEKASASGRDRPVGASWMTREDRASEIADYVEYLDALFDAVSENADDSPPAINVVGFSQGGATATRWVTHGRARISRLILWGSLLPPETDLSGHALRRARLTLVIGNRDQYIDDAGLGAEQARLDAAKVPYDAIRFDGGHVVRRGVFPQLVGASGAFGPSGAS
jgi:predicted esterase